MPDNYLKVISTTKVVSYVLIDLRIFHWEINFRWWFSFVSGSDKILTLVVKQLTVLIF